MHEQHLSLCEVNTTTYSKLNKCCLGISIREGSSGEAAAPQSWSQEEAQQCDVHFWAATLSDQREHDVHNKDGSTPLSYHIYLMHCHHAARLCRDVMSHCHITMGESQCDWRCHVSCPNWPPHVNNSFKCLFTTLLLLFQKQVLGKTT